MKSVKGADVLKQQNIRRKKGLGWYGIPDKMSERRYNRHTR